MDSAAAETYARLLAEAELRRAVTSPGFRWLDPDYELTGQPPDEEGLLRVRAVVSALGQVGALTEETGRSVLVDLAAALAVRGLRAPGALLTPATAGGPSGPAAAPSAGRSRPGHPGGYRAIPVGVVLPADLDGYQGDVHLQALVLAPDRAAIVTCFVSTWREATARPAGQAVAQPSFPPFGGSGLTDDQGRSYRLSFEAGEGGWQERGVLDISPVPPEGTRWLDLPTGSGPVIRISLAGAGRRAGSAGGASPRDPWASSCSPPSRRPCSAAVRWPASRPLCWPPAWPRWWRRWKRCGRCRPAAGSRRGWPRSASGGRSRYAGSWPTSAGRCGCRGRGPAC